jgi:hypothetical protein
MLTDQPAPADQPPALERLRRVAALLGRGHPLADEIFAVVDRTTVLEELVVELMRIVPGDVSLRLSAQQVTVLDELWPARRFHTGGVIARQATATLEVGDLVGFDLGDEAPPCPRATGSPSPLPASPLCMREATHDGNL